MTVLVGAIGSRARFKMTFRPRWQAFLACFSLATASCGGGHSSRILLDPDAFGSDQGTLVSIGDVRNAAEAMIQSMNLSSVLSRLRAEKKPLRISVGNFKQRTSITIFDKEIFLNRLLSSLTNADTDGSYAFLRRGSGALDEGVEKERRLQEAGEVKATPGAAAAPTGAELVLNGELREILYREPTSKGGELEKRIVQYTLALDQVSDARRLWQNSYEVVKEQITGAVYR